MQAADIDSEEFGLVEIAISMIEMGADINFKGSYAVSILSQAIVSYNFCIARALIRAGAELDSQDEAGQYCALWHAC